MSYVTLTNGMRYVLTALDQEMTAAVVAEEIGSLASQTSSTVSNINGITTEVNQSVQSMEACLQETLNFLEKTVLKDYSDFMGVAEKYTEDATMVHSLWLHFKILSLIFRRAILRNGYSIL